MVKFHPVYTCDCCQKTSTKPLNKIKYRTISSPFEENFDLCSDCCFVIQWGYIYNIVRDDLTVEQAMLEEVEDEEPRYKMVDITDKLKDIKMKTQFTKEIENDR